jgi:hypothetical protein
VLKLLADEQANVRVPTETKRAINLDRRMS